MGRNLTDGAALEQEPAAHRIEFVGYWLNEVRIDVQTDALVISWLGDMYYPRWQATVNGESAEILKSQHRFPGYLPRSRPTHRRHAVPSACLENCDTRFAINRVVIFASTPLVLPN